jgi:hypothetical protein
MSVYPWIVFLHVASALGFVMAHGVSVAAAFALLRQREPARVRALLELSAGSIGILYLSLLLILATGIASGLMGGWWGRGWIWASLILLVALVIAMAALGGRHYGAARKVAGLPYQEGSKTMPALPPGSPEELDAALSRANPHLLAVIGFGGLLVILWLMMFKPF